MPTNETAEAAGLVERVRALGPMIAEHAAQAERDRKPVDSVIEALKATGVFKSLVPRRFGGFEIDTDTFIDIGLAVGEACTSTGWVTTFYIEHNWILSQFPSETVEAVLGKQPYILAPASITPSGQAEKTDDGYVLNGRWAWGTGVMHGDWAMLNGVLPDGDGIDVRLFLVPIDQISVDDNWDCSGMAGTGSNDMTAEGVHVPTAYSESLRGMVDGRGSGSASHGSPRYRHPMLPLLAIAAATPALGAARRAVALFRERLDTRTTYGTLTKQAERGGALMRLGHASARVDEAEILLRDVGRRLDAWGVQEDVCSQEERTKMRLQIAHVVEISRDVVRTVMEASGASAQMRSHPMQRIHRDVHTVSCHTVFDLDLAAENYGRILLGQDPISPT